jgi:hypothetical protein
VRRWRMAWREVGVVHGRTRVVREGAEGMVLLLQRVHGRDVRSRSRSRGRSRGRHGYRGLKLVLEEGRK